jgi:hypothetical protein
MVASIMHLAVVSRSSAPQSPPSCPRGIAPFGIGCGQRGARLDVYGAPVPGGAIEFHLRAAAPLTPHQLLLGFSRTTWKGTPLPSSPPASFGFGPSCALAVSIDLAAPIGVGAAGTGFLALLLDPSLAGSTFHVQAIGLTGAEPFYATAGTTVDVGTAPAVLLSGTVQRAGAGGAVANARLTAFSPELSTFFETRSDAAGT